MHSLKNTIIAVLLLGVSYGVYELITAPDPLTVADRDLIGPLVVSDGNDGLGVEPPLHNVVPEAVNPLSQQENHAENTGSLIPVQPPVSQQTAAPTQDSSSDSIIRRQPKMNFSNETEPGNQLASADIDDSNNQLPDDFELIDALREQLGTDESEINSDSFDSEPLGEMTAVVPRPSEPETAATEIIERNPLDNRIGQPSNTPEFSDEVSPQGQSLAEVWGSVEKMTQQLQLRTALSTLTRYYNDATLTPEQQQRLFAWLDALAGKVIYSTEHHLTSQPYVVQPEESIVDIATKWNVTAQLVYNVNRNVISDPSNLDAGAEIKAIQGPFHAEVDLSQKILTVFVDDLYAGRFVVKVNSESEIQPGRYGVVAKSPEPQTANTGQPLDANNHGAYWIGLEAGLCMQEVGDEQATQPPRCIGLKPKDAADLFSIFTDKSLIFVK